MRAKLIILIMATVAVVAYGFATGSNDDDQVETAPEATTTADDSTTTIGSSPATTAATSITGSTIVDASDGAKPTIFVTNAGAVTIVLAKEGSQYRVRTPCGGEARLSSGKVYGATTVVLDPGHGGFDPGASSASGLNESDLNLDVSKRAKALLDAMGYTTVLTREADYYVPVQIRAEIALAAAPKLFVSIHHNGGEAATRQGPGTEVYHQVQSAPAKRLAGLMWEEIVNSFTKNYNATWRGASDAGVIFRPDRDGRTDFFGVLRRTYPTIPSVLIEAGYMSNPQEAALMDRADYRQNEAQAVANAVKRYLTTTDPGSGFKDPIDRGFETGTGGGGFDGCTEPKFN
ncbi:MAG TPA: N-acetylmuramoyl-L-alanine amidase [Acidimicrobiales bacterium]|nr:N-acetylmuramoyl-L-alanine amidase [Acidimicrobiales bacterium]